MNEPGGATEPWKAMPRWELVLWLLFVLVQPPAVVFFLADDLTRWAQDSGRPYLAWAFLAADVALLAVMAWRLRATRRPPDPSGRYARRQRSRGSGGAG